MRKMGHVILSISRMIQCKVKKIYKCFHVALGIKLVCPQCKLCHVNKKGYMHYVWNCCIHAPELQISQS